MRIDNLQQHETLIEALLAAPRWPPGTGPVQRIDTHISSVVLAGDFAYKFKKPVDFGFLNFLSLADRRHWCEEELRLNRRTAPDIYLAVVPVTGSAQAPHLEGPGEPIDWAVKMRRFDPQALLANHVQLLTPALLGRLAERVAHLHAQASTARGDEFGTPEHVLAPMRENFLQLRQQGFDDPRLERLKAWTERRYAELAGLLENRRANGCIRECHGDLHLGNIALIDDAPVIFDAIEFNPALRWIDPISDIAFLAMDLCRHGLDAWVSGLLDRYLSISGDYAGLPLLHFYAVYRALVRAKVAALQRPQAPDPASRTALDEQIEHYLALAQRLATTGPGALLITHGLSGSGKSTRTAALPWQLPLIRVRSDVERKRLLALHPAQDATTRDGYSRQMTARTYRHLAECAEAICAAGFGALIDATFLRADQRAGFRDLARRLAVPFLIIDCTAPADMLRQRILARRSAPDNVSDAGLDVLALQQREAEPLSDGERALSLRCGPDQPLDVDTLGARIGIGHGHAAP